MASTGNYYLNGPSLAASSAVFNDIELTIKASDGWYSDGQVTRHQLSGTLLPQEKCGGNFVPINISAVALTGDATCSLPLDQICYNQPVSGGTYGVISEGDTLYQDFCQFNLLPDGYYNATGSLRRSEYNWIKVESGIVTQLGFCNNCYQYLISTLTTAGANYIDCNGDPAIINIGGSSGRDDVYFCAIYGSPVGYGDILTLEPLGPCTS